MTDDQALSSVEALLHAMETCHICQAVLLLADRGPVSHCEDCTSDCEDHPEPSCESLQVLHSKAKEGLQFLKINALIVEDGPT